MDQVFWGFFSLFLTTTSIFDSVLSFGWHEHCKDLPKPHCSDKATLMCHERFMLTPAHWECFTSNSTIIYRPVCGKNAQGDCTTSTPPVRHFDPETICKHSHKPPCSQNLICVDRFMFTPAHWECLPSKWK
ncbi:hypothetical protein GE061_003091 [Apolygus lucorum]|uniref:Uncharacterized protein n=1 Tax=Apolygus lucorum TaxID=248454 RepID=A0A6A4J5L9_APOLU|nr:hypothetical protein GE061_003091 [Apolygus lucorum]